MQPHSLLNLVARQVVDNATTTATTAPDVSTKPTCGGGGLDPDAQFNIGLHVGALFIILGTSTFGKLIMRLELTNF